MRQNYNFKFSVSAAFTVLCVVVFSFSGTAQVTPQDTTKTGVSLGRISLPTPSSIISSYEYDPIINRYIYTEKLGDFNISPPLILTPEEYQDLIMEERMQQYFQHKMNALSGRKQGTEEDQRNLLPNFYVDSNFFESIFGGGEIELIPQGSVAMDMGVLYSKRDNPAFSPRNRSTFTFDFDQRIQLSLVGHVGEKLEVTANYDTESTFDFQNQLKLEYTPNEDDIIQKIEVGNISMPLNSTLIQGAQSLFGLKTVLQFGKTKITGVFSEQKSERRTVNVEGGAAIQKFERFVLEYDESRHYFLAHYFRDHYNEALKNYPFINSNIQITRIEVWVTNRSNSTQNLTNSRNIVGIQDLAETNIPGNIGLQNLSPGFFNNPPGAYPSNKNNDFNPFGINGAEQSILTPAIRDIATVQSGFGGLPVSEGTDYVKLQNARQLEPSEYQLNPKLGYISLNQALASDEILAVAFQYTVGGEVYQVGEFASNGINPSGTSQPNQSAISQNLVVKLLKSTVTNVEEPIWDLMMKNIYSLGAFQVQEEDFTMNIVYTDPQPLNYITGVGEEPLPEDVEETTLLKVFNLDHLNQNGDPISGGDGFFDYVPGLTIDPVTGSVIFTTVEPFGEYLFHKLDATPNSGPEDYDLPSTYNANQEKYVFNALYNTTKTQAMELQADKNKFQLRGRYKSESVDGIPIGAFNVPRGSVTVTAGGRVLQEGVDYVVNYQFGKVQILDKSLLASNIPIQISTENNALFGQQTKRFTGVNVEHQFNENFLIGATYLNLNERPLTQKSNYGYEPINNTIFGFNMNYSTKVPFLTRMVNKLPNIDTDVVSNASIRGEFAYLLPGAPKGNEFNGKTTTYVDDFEAAQTSISIDNPLGWELSSVPIGFGGELPNNDLESGFQRAKLAWYTIDPIFYSSQKPSGISNEDLSNYATRRVFMDEIFPNVDLVTGQSQVLYTMDLAYYPSNRGPYNYNPMISSGKLPNPAQNFGGISRAINSSDFEQSNVQFIEFWLMDPYIYPENSGKNGGTITFNLGSISEDVLKDGRKQYENGLPKNGGLENTLITDFGKIPANQSLIYAFNTEGQERVNQDVGFDGYKDVEEGQQFPAFSNVDDPSADNYQYFLNSSGGILERYYKYNGSEGNTPTNVGAETRGNTTLPTVEDINRDNTMNTVDSYFEYEIPVFPGMDADNNNYITDVKEFTTTLTNGKELPVRWLQFKVPIYEPTKAVGGIAGFRSIRFMRLYLTDFEEATVLRFGTMDLVRGDYRRYTQTLDPDKSDPVLEETLFEVSAVSIEENEHRQPIPYVLPPGLEREELLNNNTRIRQNEQSLSLRVCGLETRDSRAVYKNFRIDMRQYKNLEMFIHAESLANQSKLEDGNMVAFIRMGTDFTDNFYQIEIPLKPTEFGATSATEIWPEENKLNVPLDLLQKIKSIVIGNPSFLSAELNFFDEEGNPVSPRTPRELGELRVGIKGNPSFGNIRILMLGVKNGLEETSSRELCGEVWFNELRLSDLKNEGGWAAVVNMDANVADFANFSATGRRSTVGFGSIEQGPNMRSREDVQQYNVLTNMNMGQLFPAEWGLKIPVSYSIGEELITPKYDPEYLDLELETVLDNAATPEIREQLKERAENYTKRQSINIIGLRKERTDEDKPMPYDIENFTVSTSYNQIDHRDFQIAESFDQNVRLGATYNYNFAPFIVEPLKNVKALDSSAYFALFRDFNLNLLPTNISASSTIFRQYNEQTFREINLPPGFMNGIPTLYQRNFLFDWQYSLNYNLTKSLRFNFTSSTNRIVQNYLDEEYNPDTTTGIWDGFFNIGKPNQHFQSLQVNYDIPFQKVPFLEFIKATYSYTGNFKWERGAQLYRVLEDIPDLGNSIQNSNTHQINANLEMQSLYDYLGFTKKTRDRSGETIEERSKGVPTLNPGKSEEKEEVVGQNNRLDAGSKSYNTLVGLLTSIKRVQVNYEENNGIFLPGYTNNIGFLGTLNPTPGFTFGSQSEIRFLAARKGWLTLYDDFNQQYTEVEGSQLNIQVGMDLLPDLTIDLSGRRLYSETFTENYKVQNSRYIPLTPRKFGNFNISTILIATAFNQSSEESSATFQQFRENRLEIARRLAVRMGKDPNNTDEDGFPVGFGKTNQKVLLPAFLAAYSGRDASKSPLGAFRGIPLPNWDIKYTGFMRLPWFKEHFKRFSVNHGYRAGYTINQFQTNLDYEWEDPFAKDQAGNFINKLLISNINLTEQFSPLIRIDFEMQNSVKVLAEIQKDRVLSLSFDNNLLTEINGNQYTLGLGYRIKDLKIATNFGGRKRILSSDLNFMADISYRHNETIIRYLDLDNNQITAGQDIWAINFKADYALSKNLTALIYYDHIFSEYAISTAFPQTTIRSGITLRYNFGN